SYQMIYREPVVHELPLVRHPTLFVMGADDRAAPGRPYAPPVLGDRLGHNAELAAKLAPQMADARVVTLPGVGHVPHLEAPDRFARAVLDFLGRSAQGGPE
ncbi:MAG: alpha/beta hydrolase, partial [Alphaproteobacteria bacterium]|nr:alpha/beta hydrolase [Alphaproteobacteria bacterium]